MAEVENKRSSINLSEVDPHAKNVRAVKNVALAEAVELQKPNMFTRSMMMVCHHTPLSKPKPGNTSLGIS